MTYQSGELILASDYNTFVRGGPNAINPNVPNVNVVWGFGWGSRGYGQVGILPPVTDSNYVRASHWLALIDRINEIKRHQVGEAGWTPISRTPTVDGEITALSRVASAITAVYDDRLLSVRNAVDITSTPPIPYMWHSEASGQITITATWADADQARYFFNAGGRLRFTLAGSYFSHNATLRGTEWAGIVNRLGTLVLHSAGSARIGGEGGSLIENSVGYYSLLSYNQTMLSLGPALLAYGVYGSGYGNEDSMTIRVRSNGTQGTRGDAGTQITFSIDFEDLAYGGGTDMALQIIPTFTVRPPSSLVLTTPIANPTIAFSSTFNTTPPGYS